MEAPQPRVRVIHRRCTPKTIPCPHCGQTGRRNGVHTRLVRDIAYREVVLIELTVGEYRARCSCCKTFRAQVAGIEPRAEYSNRVREAVIDRLLDDNLNRERLREALRRDFHLELSEGFLYGCLDWKVRQLDLPDYRQWTLRNFSGTLCIDELHLGHRTLLLATDPVSDFPVAFALVSANDQEHLRRFLQDLKNHGFLPRSVITDGSNLYPKLLAELWPAAQHQLCIFHVLKDINERVLDAVRRLRRQWARQSKGKRRRGRLSKSQKRARARYEAAKRKQAHFIWKHRLVIVTCPENLTGHDRRIALEEGFTLQTRKSRFMRQGVRQQLAGVVVNAHPNLRRDEYDRLKAILTNCVRHGPASQNRDGHSDFCGHLAGRIAYVTMLNPARGQRLRRLFEQIPPESF